MQEKVTIRIQKFNIKEPVPAYDRLKAHFQQRYDIQVYNELIASLNYAIGTYTNNEQNTMWSSDYLSKAKIQICCLFLGGFLFFLSYFGITMGFAFNIGLIWKLSLCGFIVSIICGIVYLIIWCKLKQSKTKYAENIEPLVQNALNLLNTKYQNKCVYGIDKVFGSSQFDFSVGLSVRIHIRIISQNVYYINNNAVDGYSEPIMPQTVVVQPYNTNNHKNGYAAFEGRNETPLVQTNITMK